MMIFAIHMKNQKGRKCSPYGDKKGRHIGGSEAPYEDLCPNSKPIERHEMYKIKMQPFNTQFRD